METLHAWLGDLNQIPGLGREIVGLICILASALCGAVIGIDRERRDKPAGLRTLILICVGSTIFTLVSLMLAAQKPMADPARLAAQIIPGIGFLGAGAIIQSRGIVRGLTTGATIWSVAAVGVAVGSGYVAAGLVFTLLILVILTIVHRLEWIITGRCRHHRATIVYRPDRGKTRPRLVEILEAYGVREEQLADGTGAPEERVIEAPVCTFHREHRGVLKELAEIAQVVELRVE